MLILACLYNFNYVMPRAFRENLASKRCPGVVSPGGRGDERMGVCGGLCPTLSPIPFSSISVQAWKRQRTGGHSLNQTHWAGQLCWTAGCG